MASNKRPAPSDFSPPPSTRRSSPPGPPLPPSPEQALVKQDVDTIELEIVNGSQAWIETLQGEAEGKSEDEYVQFRVGHVRDLVSVLQSTVASYLERPATKGDIHDLMAHITEQLAPFHPPPQQQLPRTPTQPSAGASLPFDILVLILSQLRDLYTEDQDSDLIFGHRGGRYAWHASLKSLATISPAFKEAAGSHYKAELHIVDIKHLPRNATALKEHPKRAQRLRTLTIRVFDWDYAFSGGRNSDDAGFAIPDLCGTAPNLRNLSLTSDRATTYPSSGHRNAHERFSTLTGGVSVPSVIQTSLHSLRTLLYGAPCTLADVCMFASDLPLLKHLDILGEVDHAVLPPSGFKACSPSLRRFWAPTAALTSHNLETLLTLPSTDDNSSNPSSQPHITSLAFSFDPEASATSPLPPSEDEIMDEIASLSALFAGIGEQLVELQVSTPHADLPDPRGQGGLLQHIGVVVLQNAAAFGGAAAAGGAGGAGAGAGGAGNAAGGGGNAAPAGGAPAAAAAPPPAATQPAGRQRRRAAVSAGGAAGPAGRAPAGGAAAGGGIAANPFANLGNPGGGGPLQFNFAIPAPPPPTPFFEVLIEYTPNLERLELFGRRYAADLLPFLSKMPLQNLALSVPVDTVREKVVADLLELLMGGEWKTLKRLDLSGRGGEWAPSERRQVKSACEARGVLYRSTDMKN